MIVPNDMFGHVCEEHMAIKDCLDGLAREIARCPDKVARQRLAIMFAETALHVEHMRVVLAAVAVENESDLMEGESKGGH